MVRILTRMSIIVAEAALSICHAAFLFRLQRKTALHLARCLR